MGNISCSFVDDDWCGYTDVSEGQGTWFRGLDISFGEFKKQLIIIKLLKNHF